MTYPLGLHLMTPSVLAVTIFRNDILKCLHLMALSAINVTIYTVSMTYFQSLHIMNPNALAYIIYRNNIHFGFAFDDHK